MAVLKGPGSLKHVNLIVRVQNHKEGSKSQYSFVDAQVDQSLRQREAAKSDPTSPDASRVPLQTNPHLSSRSTPGLGYGFRSYTDDQVAKMRDAAGPNAFSMKYNGRSYTVLGIRADLLPASDRHGLIVNTSAPMGPTTNRTFDEDVFARQEAVTGLARERAAAAREAAAAKTEEKADAEAETAPEESEEAAVEGPSM